MKQLKLPTHTSNPNSIQLGASKTIIKKDDSISSGSLGLFVAMAIQSLDNNKP